MDDRDPPLRPMPSALWLGLIMALALIFAASFTRPAAAQGYSGTVEPCLSAHGDRNRYEAGLTSTGWAALAPEGRDRALDMLTDAYLPVILGPELPVGSLVARRAEARGFWEDFSRNRTLMSREGQVLLLAGLRTAEGEMTVECWVAGPAAAVTDDLFDLVGPTLTAPGVRMAQINLPAAATRPRTELLVSRLSPEGPTVSATDGLRTTIRFVPRAAP